MKAPVAVVSLLVVSLAVPAGAVAGDGAEDEEIHACADRDGNVVFQTDPCPAVAPEPPAAPAVPAAPSLPPKPKPKPRPAPSRPPATGVAPGSGAPRFVVLPRAPEPPSPRRAASPVGPVDARYATPEGTWSTFAAAMRSGDRDGALACLTGTALERLGPGVRSMPEAELRATVDAYGSVAPGGPAGPFWSLRAGRPTGPARWIFLERTAAGAWRIAAL